jgi:GGDEF domain-containing protein
LSAHGVESAAALLLLDLDLFKEVNDSMGHDAGDAPLIEVARRLVATMREARRPSHAGDTDTLYKCADLALYEAKRCGRSSWRLYVPPPLETSGELSRAHGIGDDASAS